MNTNTDHEKYRDLLSDFIEGELEDATRKEVEKHLAVCESCQQDLKLLESTLDLVHSIKPVPAPVGFATRVRKRMRQAGLLGKRRRKAIFKQMVPVEATMAVMLATMAALLILIMFQMQMDAILQSQRPLSIMVQSDSSAQWAAQVAWDAGGEVFELGEPVPPQSELQAPLELELSIPQKKWEQVRRKLQQLSPGTSLPQTPPEPAPDGTIRLIVQIRINWELTPYQDQPVKDDL